ncbi:hypothetical protein NEF87_002136 [Candidatus Lokiarchaeum ossiferum]|uniref:Right handed beta helix domain-containing protein n=1 Tax=Candidatus Lokiarchaeum ossiferum TaxID=2951803 RepID=A0ABY6HQR2_9ARCH|nr:hypothetical protein NEF87_002136 [Candidatus Lokiarchaeum sp. B-35]
MICFLLAGNVCNSNNNLNHTKGKIHAAPETYDFNTTSNSNSLEILNETDLALIATSGNGTFESPYILENLIINAEMKENGLRIENTRSTLKIQNSSFYFSELSSSFAGIFLKNCSNIIFENILCVANYHGIYIENSTNISGSLLQIWNNEYSGFRIKDSSNIIFHSTSISKGQYGQYITDSHNITLFDSEIHFSSAGIDVSDSTTLNFSYILFDETARRGIDMESCSDIEIYSNDLANCDNSKYGSGLGIYTYQNQNITLRNNTLTDCYLGTSFNNAPSLLDMQHDIDDSNLINGLPIGYIHDGVNLDSTIFENKSQLIVVNVNHTIIEDLNYSNIPYPISFYYCNNLTFESSVITNAIYPLYFCESTNCSVQNNDITDCDQYMGYFLECTDFLVSNNNFENTNNDAIYLRNTEYFNIHQNTITFSTAAIKSYHSQHTIIQNNILTNNIYGFSNNWFDNLTIYNNQINSSSYDLNFYQTSASNLNISKNDMHGKGILFSEQLGNSVFASYTIEGNLVHDKPIYCYYSESGLNPSDFLNAGQIFVVDCSDVHIENLAMADVAEGIYLLYSTDSFISNISLDNIARFGIIVSNGQNAIIDGGNITNSDTAIICRGDNMNSVENFTVGNTNIRKAEEGIRFDYVNILNISNNYIQEIFESGIIIRNWGFGDIGHNIIEVEEGTAIELIRCEEMNFTDNAMIGSGFEFEQLGGSSFEYHDSHLIPITNTVNGKPVYYYCHETGLVPQDFANAGQVILIDCADSEIADLDLSYNYYGLFASSCENLDLWNISVSNCKKMGLYFAESQFCTLSQITATYNYGGIEFKGGSSIKHPNNTISDSIISHNEGIGCYISYSYNFTIRDSLINNNTDGFYPSSSQYTHFINNTFTSNNFAIKDYYSHNLTISKCFFTNNVEGALKYQSKDLKFSNNTMVNGGIVLNHYDFEDIDTFEISNDNWINGKKLYFYKNMASLQPANFSNAGQIILFNVDNVSISSVNLSNASCGIYIIESSNISIESVESTNNIIMGGFFLDSQEIQIDQSDFSSNGDGMFFDNCLSITLNNLQINHNQNYGLYTNYLINSIISNSIFEGNDQTGIYLRYSSNNSFSSNYIVDNFEAVMLSNTECNENRFWNNSFIGDNLLVTDYGLLNRYNVNSIGNYWGNYEIRYPSATKLAYYWSTSYRLEGTYCIYDRFPLIVDPFNPSNPEIPDDPDDTTTSDTSTTDPSNFSRPLAEILVYSITGGILGVGLIGVIIYRIKLLKK